MINVSIGDWPSGVDVFSGNENHEAYVLVWADHNTEDYDTNLDRNQVIALRDALTIWLEETDESQVL